MALHIRWPKYWCFSFSISPSSEYSGFISHRIDWFDLLAIQGSLKRLLQHHSSKASILQHSAFFIVQLSHPFITIGKSHSSDGKVSVYNAGSPGSIPGLGRSPGEGNGNPLQYSRLENPRDGGAWWAAVSGVAQSRTRLKRLSSSSGSARC